MIIFDRLEFSFQKWIDAETANSRRAHSSISSISEMRTSFIKPGHTFHRFIKLLSNFCASILCRANRENKHIVELLAKTRAYLFINSRRTFDVNFVNKHKPVAEAKQTLYNKTK